MATVDVFNLDKQKVGELAAELARVSQAGGVKALYGGEHVCC